MSKKLAFIFVALLTAAAFSMPAHAQRGGHFGGVHASGSHFSGARVGGVSGARIGGWSGVRMGGLSGARVGAVPYSGARVAAAGRGIYRGGVWPGRYGSYGYRYGRYGYGRYWPYAGWAVAAGAMAAAWPYYSDYGYVADDYDYGGDYSYQPVVPRGYYGGGGCWIATDTTRGYGYYGPCN